MTKRMGGMGKLSDFGKTSQPQPAPETEPIEKEPTPAPVIVAIAATPQSKPKQEKLVTLNIKIAQTQQEWLADTARDVRGNNTDPVPPNERVFPQHLIGIAISLLESSEVDWNQIKNTQDLRAALKL